MLLDKCIDIMVRCLRYCTPHTFYEAKETISFVYDMSYEKVISSYSLVDTSKMQRITSCITRRMSGEPLEYICYRAYFRALNLYVNNSVLIPRVETEGIIDIASFYINKTEYSSSGGICVDLGTGSGAIICSFLQENRYFCGYAVDISYESLTIASRNILSLGLSHKCMCIQSFWDMPFSKNSVHVVFANPPYVSSYDIYKNELYHEPSIALDGGYNGLYHYEYLIAHVSYIMKYNGYCFIEICPYLKDEIVSIVRKSNFSFFCFHKDCYNKDRFLVLGFV